MKVVGLVSGGKDSCFNMLECQKFDHEIVALANLLPEDDSVDELDSYMYQTVGHQLVGAYAQCMGIPLYRRRIRGTARDQSLRYAKTAGDEVEDLEALLRAVKKFHPEVQGVSSGAIASDYQRLRVESVCSTLGLVSLAYLWQRPQRALLQDMIDSGIEAILVKVAAMGLHPQKHLGKNLVAMQPELRRLSRLYGINECGEGGEYESLTLDCSLFKRARIMLDDFTIILHSPDSIAPVGVLHPTRFHLVAKHTADQPERSIPNIQPLMNQPEFSIDGSQESSDQSELSDKNPGRSGTQSGRSEADMVSDSGRGRQDWDLLREWESHSIIIEVEDSKIDVEDRESDVEDRAADVAARAAKGREDDCRGVGSKTPEGRAVGTETEGGKFRAEGERELDEDCHAARGRSAMEQGDMELRVSKGRNGYLAIGCRRKAGSEPWGVLPLLVPDTGREVSLVLSAIQSELRDRSLGWAHVLYVHLYLADMAEFGSANKAYVETIREADCPNGVPSRSTVEAPLGTAGMGLAMADVLAAEDWSKSVLHVQSISHWAPSCIGPYSQCTRHGSLLLLAGQLGLDPPTMALVPGGTAQQTARALLSCEAVAQSFGTSAANCAVCFTVYCAEEGGERGRREAQAELDLFLGGGNANIWQGVQRFCRRSKREGEEGGGRGAVGDGLDGRGEQEDDKAAQSRTEWEEDEESLDSSDGESEGYVGPRVPPLVHYVVLPGLPKGALVEIAPMVFVSDPASADASGETESDSSDEDSISSTIDLTQTHSEPRNNTAPPGTTTDKSQEPTGRLKLSARANQKLPVTWKEGLVRSGSTVVVPWEEKEGSIFTQLVPRKLDGQDFKEGAIQDGDIAPAQRSLPSALSVTQGSGPGGLAEGSVTWTAAAPGAVTETQVVEDSETGGLVQGLRPGPLGKAPGPRCQGSGLQAQPVWEVTWDSLAVSGRFCRAHVSWGLGAGSGPGRVHSEWRVEGLPTEEELRQGATTCWEVLDSALASAQLSWADLSIVRVYFVSDRVDSQRLEENVRRLVKARLRSVLEERTCAGPSPLLEGEGSGRSEVEDGREAPLQLEPLFIPTEGVGPTSEAKALVAFELTAMGSKPPL